MNIHLKNIFWKIACILLFMIYKYICIRMYVRKTFWGLIITCENVEQKIQETKNQIRMKLLPNPLRDIKKYLPVWLDHMTQTPFWFCSQWSRNSVRRQQQKDMTNYTLISVTNTTLENTTYEFSHKQCLVWISRHIWVIMWIICIEANIRMASREHKIMKY